MNSSRPCHKLSSVRSPVPAGSPPPQRSSETGSPAGAAPHPSFLAAVLSRPAPCTPGVYSWRALTGRDSTAPARGKARAGVHVCCGLLSGSTS